MGEVDLAVFLMWLIIPGAGLIAAYIVARIKGMDQLEEDLKRLITGAIAAGIGIGAYLAQIAMEYVPKPETWRVWVESLFAVAFIAAGVSELSRVVYVKASAWIMRRRGLRKKVPP